jgi:hypothetical protein
LDLTNALFVLLVRNAQLRLLSHLVMLKPSLFKVVLNVMIHLLATRPLNVTLVLLGVLLIQTLKLVRQVVMSLHILVLSLALVNVWLTILIL